MWSVVFACLGAIATQEKAAVAPESCLKFLRAYELPNVAGRMDHLAYWDIAEVSGGKGQLFVAARDNGSIEHIDLLRERVRTSLEGPRRPQGIVVVPLFSLFVTDDEDGDLWAFEVPVSLQQEQVSGSLTGEPGRLKLGSNADNIRYLPRAARLLVGHGEGSLAVVELRDHTRAVPTMEVETRIDLGAHPESFQFDRLEERCWVNVPDKSAIAVVDLKAKKIARWIEVKSAKKNYPMALAEKAKRLLVGCREPAKLLVIDIDTDAPTAELPLSDDVDDIFVDEDRDLIYASCGEGFIDVFSRTDASAWKPKERVATSAGARTCLFVAAEKKLFVAVPKRGEQKAEVRVFSTAP